MSRAWQAERDLNDGTISQGEYNRAIRELGRDLQGAYEEDQQDALDAVRDEWGR